MRMEDPLNRYYRYPIARWIVRALMRTPVTPNQVTLVQPLFAALAGYMVTFDDPRALVAGALVFELRSILDCVDGALARTKSMASPAGHAIDALADWLGVTFLYAGIFWHFHLHPPPGGPWSAVLSTNGILLLAMLQAALRSFAADYFRLKYCSIFERGTDETVDALRCKTEALGPSSSFFAHVDVFIGRMGHLAFAHAWFDPERSRSSTSAAQVNLLIQEESSPLTRLIGALWAISNGDAFLSMVVLTLLVDQLWLGQVFFATGGVVWIVAVLLLNGWFIRSASRRAKLAVV